MYNCSLEHCRDNGGLDRRINHVSHWKCESINTVFPEDHGDSVDTESIRVFDLADGLLDGPYTDTMEAEGRYSIMVSCRGGVRSVREGCTQARVTTSCRKSLQRPERKGKSGSYSDSGYGFPSHR